MGRDPLKSNESPFAGKLVPTKSSSVGIGDRQQGKKDVAVAKDLPKGKKRQRDEKLQDKLKSKEAVKGITEQPDEGKQHRTESSKDGKRKKRCEYHAGQSFTTMISLGNAIQYMWQPCLEILGTAAYYPLF